MKRHNAVKIVFLLLNLILVFFCSPQSHAQKKVERGVLDLSNEQFRNRIFRLNGEWEFYWQQHLRPADFKAGDHALPDTWAEVPSYWISYSDDLPQIKNTGYATYRMTVIVPENVRQLVFDIPVFDSAFRIYIDGKYAGGNGLAGEREEETKAGYAPFTYKHNITDSNVELIVNVSNYHHRRGGFWIPVRLGLPEVLNRNIERRNTLADISTGILFAFMAFFFVFFLILRADYPMLFFALATLGILLRGISTGSYPVSTFMDNGWTTLIRMEYAGSFIALVFGAWYFHSIFPDRYFKALNTIITVIFSLALLLVLSTPVLIFSHSIRFFIPAVAIIIIYYGAKSILSMLRAESIGILNTIGFIALLIGFFNDISLSGSNIFLFSGYILPFTTIIFIFMQVIVLISRWVKSSNAEKRLLSELEYVNQNLENMVIERTSELTNQKSELEQQKGEIEVKNEELEKNIRIKNRIFSIIAHDLKTPFVNLAMLIDNAGNIAGAGDDKTGDIMQEIRGQIDFTLNLIDNLLIWGQSQQNQIEYRPEKWNITDLVLESFNLLNKHAEMKKIQLSFSHRGSPFAWFDRNLVAIILRNLVTNAIKFTDEGGRIYVLSEEVNAIIPYVRISVRDTGLGIDITSLDKLKKNWISPSTRGTRGEKGTGLGLQLCYDLVRVNRGEMNIESTRGEGTTVSFTLPTQNLP
ncbi:MAG: hypothetical protein KFF49_01060 [Bacteroidales bacterium]|nr:hypothetical protein [Bacteroidales bacterium]